MADTMRTMQQKKVVDLPMEVKANILSHLCDIDSLSALSRSCKAFHHAYCEYRKQLLFDVFIQEVGFGKDTTSDDEDQG